VYERWQAQQMSIYAEMDDDGPVGVAAPAPAAAAPTASMVSCCCSCAARVDGRPTRPANTQWRRNPAAPCSPALAAVGIVSIYPRAAPLLPAAVHSTLQPPRRLAAA